MGVILIMNLNELMIVNEQELEKLNKAIDRISQEKSRINFNRDILERLMERIEKVIPYREESEIRIITPIKYHKMLKLCTRANIQTHRHIQQAQKAKYCSSVAID